MIDEDLVELNRYVLTTYIVMAIKLVIDEDLAELNRLVATGLYSQIKYSSDSCGGFGVDLDPPALSVRKYIMEGIINAARTLDRIRQARSAKT